MKKSLFFVLLLVCIFSCTRELELSNDENGLMVLNGLIEPSENLAITLVKSSSVLDDQPIEEIKDAKVSIFKDGAFVEDLIFSESEDTPVDKYYAQVKAEPGSNYSIEVNHPQFGDVSSQTSVPLNSPVSNFRFEEASESNSGTMQLNFTLNLNDAPGDDYYFISFGLPVYRFDNNTVGDFYGFNPIEISKYNIDGQTYLDEGIIFTDEAFASNQVEFSGKGKVLKSANSFSTVSYFTPVEFDSLYLDTSKVIVRFEKLSYDTYLFYTSHASYLETLYDDYAEPTLIYSNIENGLGVFGGINILEGLYDIE